MRLLGRGQVQRREEWKHRANSDLNAFVAALDALVNTCTDLLLDDPMTVPEAYDNYLTRWTKVYAAYVEDGDHPFLYTAFGYAVESYTNFQIEQGVLDASLPPGHRIRLQAARGATRPDIVVQDGTGVDVGWFDITASGSIYHIDGKSGGGWDAMPYVAEVLYPSLDRTQLGRNGRSPAEGVKLRSAAKQQKAQFAATVESLHGHMVSWSKDVVGNKAENRAMLETKLGALLNDGVKVTPAAAKSLLAYVADVIGVDHFGTFGYTGAYANGRDRETADDLLYAWST